MLSLTIYLFDPTFLIGGDIREMSNKKITAFIVFYIGIVLAILFTFFYVQDRYGHNPPRQKSGLNNKIIGVEKFRIVKFKILTIDGRKPIDY